MNPASTSITGVIHYVVFLAEYVRESSHAGKPLEKGELPALEAVFYAASTPGLLALHAPAGIASGPASVASPNALSRVLGAFRGFY